MQTYHEREDELFHEWRIRLAADDPTADFAEDGLLSRGEINYVDGCWTRDYGDEGERWDKARRRLLILTKDLNDCDGGWDIREETARMNGTGKDNVMTCRKHIYPNLLLWAHAILNAAEGNVMSQFKEPDWDELRVFYETAPIARVNCKKEVGTASCPNSLLKKHLNNYGDLLLRQISLYDANVVLCCGGSGMIKDFLKEKYLHDLERFSEKGGWVYFSPQKRVIVIDAVHPSIMGTSRKDLYEWMMADVQDFMNRYPDFFNE